MFRFLRKLPGFAYDPRKRFRAWLRTVCTNVMHDLQRARSRRPRATGATEFHQALEEKAADETSPDVEVAVSESLKGMLDAIRERLEDDQWPVFCMIWIEELSTKEIAEKTGSTPNAIRQKKFRIKRSLAKLRDDFPLDV
jgi:RNA polymerase sigma-70 factor (ECF subfamily)